MFKLTLGKSKFLVRINYKSGNSIEMWVNSYNVSTGDNNNLLTKMNMEGKGPVDGLYLGFADIESIWKIDYRRSVWSLFSSS